MTIIETANKFIDAIKNKYGDDIKIEYYYDSQSNEIEIFHNRLDLHINNLEFEDFAGDLIKCLFYDKGFFNLSFYCDPDKFNFKLNKGTYTSPLINSSINTMSNILYQEIISKNNEQSIKVDISIISHKDAVSFKIHHGKEISTNNFELPKYILPAA